MTENQNTFKTLSKIDLSSSIKTKNNLSYLPWSKAWSNVKDVYPDASFRIIPQVMDDGGNTRFWHDDGRTGWVEVAVTINGQEITEILPIMNHKNQAIPASEITSTNANNSVKRCLVKACALHGLGLYIYEGEDLPEEIRELTELVTEIEKVFKKKWQISADAQAKVLEICKAVEKEAFPDMPDDEITGNYKNITDVELLEKLKKKLTAIRSK